MTPLARFRLSSLFLVTTTVGVLLTVATLRVNKMRSAILEVEQLGGHVWMSNECDKYGEPLGPFSSTATDGRLQSWLSTLGESDYFRSVYCIDLRDTDISNDDLAILQAFPNLRSVDLSGTPIDDAGLQHFNNMENLKCIDLDSTLVTQAGIERFAERNPQIKIHADLEFRRLVELILNIPLSGGEP